MKKLITILLAALLLLTAGCDLRNRRPSKDFIVEYRTTDVTVPSGVTPDVTEETAAPSSERLLTRHSIRTVLSENGSYTDLYGRQLSYEFTLPYVDYPSIEASRCNAEIESIYNKAIKAQKELIEAQELLSTYYISYNCYYTGELVSLNVIMANADASVKRSVYCFRSDGTFATNAELLDAVWADQVEFLSKVYEYLETQYVALNTGETQNVTYSKYYDKTVQQADDLEALCIYADEEDNLHVLANMYTADGGVSEIEFPIYMN